MKSLEKCLCETNGFTKTKEITDLLRIKNALTSTPLGRNSDQLPKTAYVARITEYKGWNCPHYYHLSGKSGFCDRYEVIRMEMLKQEKRR